MNIIELTRWKPSAENPRKLEYAGQPAAQEIFEELKHRLEGMGYLPDEYFLMDDEWKNGREIPKGADVFCTTDYGGSEGVYLDVYLKWHEEGKPIIKNFITGKTLGESGDDLDRMFLISSAITKAFHGGEATHARYMKVGSVAENAGGSVVHLSQEEQRTIIDALVEQRERQESAMSQTEQLLRRMTGSITVYMDNVGQKPLHMTDYDKAVLAIRDGELDTFLNLYPRLLDAHTGDLLMETAGRPGAVGRKMTRFLLDDVEQFPEEAYSAACQRAIDIGDQKKVIDLLLNAEDRVADLSPSFHGEMASHAYLEHRSIAREIIKQCSDAQIAAAPSSLLEAFAYEPDFRTMSMLVEKGITGGHNAWRTLHMLTHNERDRWMAEELLEKRMWVDPNDYAALNSCVKNNAVDVAKLLLDGGMDFEKYRQAFPCSGSAETIQALEEHWQELQAQEQAAGEEQEPSQPEIGGMTLG